MMTSTCSSYYCFFFSCRRRHTRWPRDWSSDVCSSDLELHLRFHGYSDGAWTDSAVRRYVNDAGDLLERLHRLTRSDSTTRNKRKAARLAAAYDDLEARIVVLQEQEELAAIRPDLNGQEIMETLGVKEGPVVGQAYKFLLDLRMEEGPLSKEVVRERLLAWWAQRQ